MPQHTPLRPGQGEKIALEALARAGRHGLNTQQVTDAMRVTRTRASMVLIALAKAGQVQRKWNGGRTLAHWWLAGLGPKDATTSTAPRTRSQPLPRVGLDPAAPAMNPHGVQPRVIPHGQDRRFTFTPPPGWRGQITRDWRERRLQESKAC